MRSIPIIDCMVNVNPGGQGLDIAHIPRDAFRDDMSIDAWPSPGGAVGFLFPGAEERLSKSGDPAHVLELFDQWNVERGQVVVNAYEAEEKIDQLLAFGDRWFFSIRVNPHGGMKAVRQLESLVKKYPSVRSCSIAPHALVPNVPPNTKEFYPIYAKLVELDLPLLINVGMPGPRLLGETQNPIYLDEVCWFLPELKVVMKHGGEPWVDTCVKLMLRWPNIYYMTSGFAPKYYPEAIVKFANTRGADKIIYAGYWPFLAYETIIDQLGALPLRDHVWEKMLAGNARRLFKL